MLYSILLPLGQKYGVKHLLHPAWKFEGHAVWNEKKYNSETLGPFYQKVTSFLLSPKKNISFSSVSKNFSYTAAFAQTWYYLDYLKMTEEEFFSSKVQLASWEEVFSAWQKVNNVYIEEHQSVTCVRPCIQAQELSGVSKEKSIQVCKLVCDAYPSVTYSHH